MTAGQGWTVLGPAGNNAHGHPMVHARCNACGAQRRVLKNNLRTGRSRGCADCAAVRARLRRTIVAWVVELVGLQAAAAELGVSKQAVCATLARGEKR